MKSSKRPAGAQKPAQAAPGLAQIIKGAKGTPVSLLLDGQTVTETIQNLAHGTYGKALPESALAKIRSQAERIVGDIVAAYTAKVGPGEVGEGGSARADGTAAGGDAPTGLLYGRVQSGKTAAMIVTTALAIDNGFRIVVVLTSNNLELVRQTTSRFRAVSGARIESSNDKTNAGYLWLQRREQIRDRAPKRGVVFVCAKESDHLEALIHFLQEIDAAAYPALIMDDEADHATPNTNLAKQSRHASKKQKGKTKAEQSELPSSTTFRLVVWNDKKGEEGKSLRQILPHNVFLQVTATPYALLLQNAQSSLRPDFPTMLHPGEGYTGGDRFFAGLVEPPESIEPEEELPDSQPPLCFVSESESATLAATEVAPEGLLRSAAFFLLAVAHLADLGRMPSEGYKHLSHTSPKTNEHQKVSALLNTYLQQLLKQLDEDPAAVSTRTEMTWAQRELAKTVPDISPIPQLLTSLAKYLDRFDVLTINSQGQQLEFRERLTFIVGGNILGRGITIDDLLVTYYLRQAKTTQMDTMHQHARMYGYRESLMPYTRVFLPFALAARFARIHENDSLLRGQLEAAPGAKPRIAIGLNLRPTRPGVLDVGSISAYGPRQQIYKIAPVDGPKKRISPATKAISALMEAIGHELDVRKVRSMVYKPATLDQMSELLRLVPVDPDESDWDTEVLQLSLERVAKDYGGKGFVGYREMRRTRRVLATGALAGAEVEDAKNKAAPVLCMFHDGPFTSQSKWEHPFWYPVVVFPATMPAIVFNRTEA